MFSYRICSEHVFLSVQKLLSFLYSEDADTANVLKSGFSVHFVHRQCH